MDFGDLLELLAIDVIAVGIIVIAFVFLYRSIWRQPAPHFPECLRSTWIALRNRLSKPGSFVFLLVSAAIVGTIVDLVADEILDDPDLARCIRSLRIDYLEEDEIKVEELIEVYETVGEAERRVLEQHVTSATASKFEDRVKGLYQRAQAAVRAADKPDLLSYIRAETRVVKILRVFFLGFVFTTALLLLVLMRHGWSWWNDAGPDGVVTRELVWPFVFAGLTYGSLWLWTEENRRLDKQVLHAYLAVAAAPLEDAKKVTARRTYAVEFPAGLPHPHEISAIATLGEELLLVSDEGASLALLRPDPTCKKRKFCAFELVDTIDLGTKGELDAEAIAIGEKAVFVAGSHARTRPGVDPLRGRSPDETWRRFASVQSNAEREKVLRIPIQAGRIAGGPSNPLNLRDRFATNHPILRPFMDLPAKENGIDIEALAIESSAKECLIAGLRGPVLRGQYAIALRTGWEPDDCTDQVLALDLGGLGIRDMVRIDSGYLVLAGPTGEAREPFEIFLWNGGDLFSGDGRTQRLARIEGPSQSSPEGVAILDEAGECLELLIAFDGWAEGAHYEICPKP